MAAYNPRVGHLVVVSTGLSAFVLSLGWYSSVLFGPIWLEYSHADPSEMPPWKTAIAPIRELVVAYVLAQLLARLDIRELKKAVALGFGLWFAFFGVSVALQDMRLRFAQSAVTGDDLSWRLDVVQAGDWFIKMLFMSLVLCAWYRSRIPVAAKHESATGLGPD